MVKVLGLDLFEAGGLLPLDAEPTAVCTASGDLLLVATTDGAVTAYAGGGTASPSALHSFSSVSRVHRLHYNPHVGAVVTLESPLESERLEWDYRVAEEADEVPILAAPSAGAGTVGWVRRGETVLVTHSEGRWLRVHGVLRRCARQRQKLVPRLYYNWRKGSPGAPAPCALVHQREQLGSTLSAPSVHAVFQDAGTDGCGVVCAMSLQHGDTLVTSLAVCPCTGNIAIGSRGSVGVHIVRAAEAPSGSPGDVTVHQLLTLAPKGEVLQLALCRNFVGYASGTECHVLRIEVASADAPVPLASTGGAAVFAFQPGTGDAASPDAVAHEMSVPFEPASELHRQWVAVGAPAQLSDGWSLRGNAAGSPVAVADQGLQVRPGSGFVARGCYRYLYLEAEDESAPFHTLLLSAVPDDATPAGAGTAAASTSPLAPPAQPLHICCFVSEPRHGRMYGLDDGGLAPLAQYNYVNPTSAAVLNDCLLYVMTSGESGGVDAYTLRCRGPSLASDITFVGSKHLMSPAEISICDLTLAVAVRHGGAATAVAGFNVYSLRQIALDALYDQIIAAGKEQEENWPFYHQILLEGHYMLQAHLAALKRAGSAEAMVRCRAKFSASCLTLGTHLCTRRAAPDWAAAAEFYAASGAPLTAVLARMMPEEVREHASDTTRLLQPGTDPARRGAALLSVCDRVLIDGSSPEACAELDDAEVAAIFKLYFELAPGRLGALATAPTMAGHAPAQVLPLLLALIASEPEPAPALRLGATLLHIGARDVAAAMLLLRGGLVSHCLDWCTRHPELLVRDSHHSPDVCTALGVLLRERFAAEFDALAFGVRSPLSPATAVAALRPAHDAHRRLIGALPAAIASRSAAGDDKGAAVFSHAFIEAGLAVFVPAASGGEAPGWLAPTCARSPASARPIWLDSLPPFDDPGHSLMSPAAMALLGRLQGVLAACCTGGSGAEPFLELVRAASARTYIGRLSLELLCLPATGRCDEALRTLLRVCPAAVPGYARAHLPATGHCGRWRSLLQTVVALHELSTRGGSEAGRGTGGGALLENKGDSGDTIGSIELGRVAGLHNAGAGASTYRMVCRAMLELIAERVSPVELLDALPENGAADFFVPYLARALEAQSARTMGQDINGLAAAVE